MDWQGLGANLVISAIVAILLILANWMVNEWDRRSEWGRWKQAFLRYNSVLEVYNKIQKEHAQIIEKLKTFGGILYLISLIFVLVEIILVPFISSWLEVTSEKVYSFFMIALFLLEMFLLSILLTNVVYKVVRRDNTMRIYRGVRYIAYAIYISSVGIVLAAFNLGAPERSVVILVLLQVLEVGISILVNKYLELSLFSILWKKRVISDESAHFSFPFVHVTLKSGKSVRGQLFDFMDNSSLVLRNGMEYVHVRWSEIEVIRILSK